MKHKIIIGLAIFVASLLLFVAIEFIYILQNGKSVEAPTIPRNVQALGTGGSELKYAIMGDSTSIGQGAKYADSYSYQSAEHLAEQHQVKLLNVGISGAVAKDLITTQLDKIKAFKPDIVLLAVGANDATHFTSGSSMKKSLQTIVDGLNSGSCKPQIIVTGSPAMGSVSRFPIGARQVAGLRARQINKVYYRLIAKNDLIFAPVAARTGKAFAQDPTLFAQDNFHPNARGYRLWTPVINEALDTALAKPNDCFK